MKSRLDELKRDLEAAADPVKKDFLPYFFKTGPGQYGEGDVFLGVTMPKQRLVAKNYLDLSLHDIQALLASPIHEHRMTGLIILGRQFKKGNEPERKTIYNFYLKQTARVNNWDLVDQSAPEIVGGYLVDKDRGVLDRLARSDLIWERRIAMVATWTFIRLNQFEDTLRIAEILLSDTHDLIHKAVGWMLREMGKRDEAVLIKFLDQHFKVMPRTALRYSIERLDPAKRAHYMAK